MVTNIPLQSSLSAAGYTQHLPLSDHVRVMEEGFRQLGLIRPNPADYGNTANQLCKWVARNAWVEPTLYDHAVPADHVTPLSLYPDDLPWTALTWCVDPYHTSVPYDNLGSQFYDRCWQEKDEPYLIKSLNFNHLELSWICYNQVGSLYLIHHNQIRGTMRDRLSRTDQVWLHRYMLRQFVQMVPANSTIVIPDSQTLDKYLEIHPELLRMPMTPFSYHVVGKSKFDQIDATALCEIAPDLHDTLYFTNELPLLDQRYWIRTT